MSLAFRSGFCKFKFFFQQNVGGFLLATEKVLLDFKYFPSSTTWRKSLTVRDIFLLQQHEDDILVQRSS